jgi:hypothetical protein
MLTAAEPPRFVPNRSIDTFQVVRRLKAIYLFF